MNLVGPLQPGDLPPVLDLEIDPYDPTYIADHTKIIGPHAMASYLTAVEVWLNLIEQHYKVRPIIYTSKTFWADATNNDDRFRDYPLWVCSVNLDKYHDQPERYQDDRRRDGLGRSPAQTGQPGQMARSFGQSKAASTVSARRSGNGINSTVSVTVALKKRYAHGNLSTSRGRVLLWPVRFRLCRLKINRISRMYFATHANHGSVVRAGYSHSIVNSILHPQCLRHFRWAHTS